MNAAEPFAFGQQDLHWMQPAIPADVDVLLAIGSHHQQAQPRQRARQVEQQRHRIGVHPMQIVEQQEQGPPGAEAAQESTALFLQLHPIQA